MKRFVVFALGGEEFGIDVDRIVEVRNAGDIKVMPDLPDYMPGLIDARGEVIPLMDMRKRFSLASTSEKQRVLIVRIGGEKIALLVEAVKEILPFEKEEIASPPSIFKGLKNEYLEGLGKKENRAIILLDLDGLLSSREMIMLETARKSVKTSKA
jgi:purine-binding chemotaxis protein CheW